MSAPQSAPQSASQSASQSSSIEHEWLALHRAFEAHERNALWIKLIAIVLCGGAVILSLNEYFVSTLVVTLWIQEAVIRTFQSRLGSRILRVEQLIRDNVPGGAFQLHSEWLAQRKRGAAMLGEYAVNALRPTVAYPYIALILIDMSFAARA